jgi:probable HAF family extracellular repeat protein
VRRALISLAIIGSVAALPAGQVAPAGAAPEAAAASQAPRYIVEFVPNAESPQTPLVPRGINEDGHLTGWFDYPSQAWVNTGGDDTVFLPRLPGKAHAFAWEINDHGQVAGSSGFETIDPPERAVRWTGGVPQDLGTLGTDSRGFGINNLGHVVGLSYVNGSPHGFFWSEESGMVDVAPGIPFTVATDVNEQDQVTGGAGNGHAFRWQDGVFEDLGAPPGRWAYSSGNAINERGQVAGNVTTASGNEEDFARYTDGVGWEVLGGSGQENAFHGINDRGDMVGVGRSGGFDKGFLYIDGQGLFLLDSLLVNDDWRIVSAWDINNRGEIAAFVESLDGTNRYGAARLIPATGTPVHVAKLTLRLQVKRDGVQAKASVTALDDAGRPVQGAKVVGEWEVNGFWYGEGAPGRTSARGVAQIQKTLTARSGDTVEVCIDEITKRGFYYDSSQNAVTCTTKTVP